MRHVLSPLWGRSCEGYGIRWRREGGVKGSPKGPVRHTVRHCCAYFAVGNMPQFCRLPTACEQLFCGQFTTHSMLARTRTHTRTSTQSKLSASAPATLTPTATATQQRSALCGGAIYQKDTQAKKNYEMAIIIVGTHTRTHDCYLSLSLSHTVRRNWK